MIGFILGVLLSSLIGWFVVQYFRQDLQRAEEEKERLEQEKTIVLEFMHNLVEGVGEDPNRQGLYERIIHAAVLGTGAVSGSLYIPVSHRRLKSVASEGLFPPQKPLPEKSQAKISTRARFISEVLRSEELQYGEGLIGEVASNGQAFLVNQAESDSRILQHGDQSLRVRSMLAVPMFYRKRFLGVIALVNSADGMGFSETDFSLVQSLAEQAALAIHNTDQLKLQMDKQRLDMDLALASNIQGMLLPRSFPNIPGFDLSASYQTAQQVGGDMYSVIDLSGGRLGVAIADVSGKGIAASLLMAICQTSLGHLAQQHDSPAKLLSAMNAEVIQETRDDMFVTMVYAIIDPAAGEMVLARAGHELPLHLVHGESGERLSCDTIESEGMALGMVESEIFDMVIEDTKRPWSDQDVLVLYTDGITERVNEHGAEYSTARLMDLVRTLHLRDAADIRDGILLSVERFAGDEAPTDDQTLLVVRYDEVDKD